MTRLTLFTFLVFVTLCVQLTFVAASNNNINNPRDDNNIEKCDSLWWKNNNEYLKWIKSYCKKISYNKEASHLCEKRMENWNLDEWEKLEESKRDNKNKSSKPDIKDEIWSKWSSFSKCRCKSINWKVKNPAGVSLCYQITWFDKVRGNFVGELSIIKSKESKNAMFNLLYKMPNSVKTVKTSRWKGQEKLDNSTLIVEKLYIYGKIPKYQSTSETFSIDMISPSQSKINIRKRQFSLTNNDVKTLSTPNFLISERELPSNNFESDELVDRDLLGDIASELPKLFETPTQTQTQTPSPSPSPSPSSSRSNPPRTSSPPPRTSSTPKTSSTPNTSRTSSTPKTSNTPKATNSPKATNPPEPINPSTPGTSSSTPENIDTSTPDATTTSSPDNAQSQNQETSDENGEGLPGMSLGVLPIGLIIFGGIVVIGLLVYFYSIYDKSKWRKVYRSRQESQRV